MPTSILKKILIFIGLFAGSSLQIKAQLQLPFFDDFSKTGLSGLDGSLWKPSGVNINNDFFYNPPNQFIITFDGLDKQGFPYDAIDIYAVGPTDSLCSKSIDLSKHKKSDSLSFGFYWMAGGLTERPDRNDSLVLYFLNKSNQWKSIWNKNVDSTLTTSFLPVQVFIEDSSYFHSNFQFQFVAYGRQSGGFDTWHVDNITLDLAKNTYHGFYQDASILNFTPLLKRYSSMPLTQFLVAPQKEFNDSISYKYKAYGKNTINVNSYLLIKDLTSNTTLQNQLSPFSISLTPLLSSYQVSEKINFDLTKITKPTTLAYGVYLEIKQDNILQNKVLTNDSLFYKVNLSNYYAYDDGTAESAADIDIRLGSIATRFILNKPDSLGAVQINFSPYLKNRAGDGFYLQVFDSKNGLPNKVIYEQNLKIKYPDELNGFIEYDLLHSVAVKDTFFVGWTRLTDEFTPIGFDKDTPEFAKNIFYNLGKEWIPNWKSDSVYKVKGSFMLRPVMKNLGLLPTNGDKVTANEEETTTPVFFPNPSKGIIINPFEEEITFRLVNSAGKIVFQQNTSNSQIDVSEMPNGIYFINVKTKTKLINQKIIILK